MISGIVGLFVALVGGVIAVAAFAFWIWMLIHAITNHGLSDGEKIAWVLIILFLHFLGALIYFFVGRPKGSAASGNAVDGQGPAGELTAQGMEVTNGGNRIHFLGLSHMTLYNANQSSAAETRP